MILRDRKINKGGMHRTFGLTGYFGSQTVAVGSRAASRGHRTGKSVRKAGKLVFTLRLRFSILIAGRLIGLDIQKNIAAAIRAAMEERQLSLTEFSKELGIGKSSLQAYLNGQQNMRSDTIELIAEKLEITPAELVSYPAEQQPPSENLHPLLKPIEKEFQAVNKFLTVISDRLYELEAQLEERGEDVPHGDD